MIAGPEQRATPAAPSMSATSPARVKGRHRRPRLDEDTRRDRLEQFQANLTQQVLTLTSTPAWTNWLQTAARFHTYSGGNTIAIWAQRPDATRVAGYRAWQAMGRQVRTGEQGIQILAPVTRQPQPATDTGDTGPPEPTQPTVTQGDPPSGELGTRHVVGVRLVHVFDVSQTDGDPLPDLEALHPSLLTGQAPEHLWDGLAEQVAQAGYQLTDKAGQAGHAGHDGHAGGGGLPAGTNGLTNFIDRLVLVRPELDAAQRVKTLAHELGHVLLHEPQDGADRATDQTTTVGCRGQQEVEAESVAFLVTSAHGMDTGQYSFGYVAGWALQTTDVEATLRATAARVLTTSHGILDRLDRDHPPPLAVAEDASAETTVAISRVQLDGAAHQRQTAPARGRAPDPGISR